MKKLLLVLMMTFSSVAMVLPEAEARRMGGGGSFGKQYSRPAPSQPAQQQGMQQTQPTQNTTAARQQQNAAAPGAAAQRPSMMRNILGGALLGLGLGALLAHFGIGGALASIIGTILTFGLIALAVMFLYRLFVRRNGNNGMQPAYANPYAKSSTPEIGSGLNPDARPAAFGGAADSTAMVADNGIPADFDTTGFLRNAKTYFIRLQAAWDKAEVNDIREFTTPEMFAELRMQLQERGALPNHTDVMSLDAELLGIETLENEYLASVRFNGMIREEEGVSAQPFTEVWNLSKPISGGGWLLAGIQQVS